MSLLLVCVLFYMVTHFIFNVMQTLLCFPLSRSYIPIPIIISKDVLIQHNKMFFIVNATTTTTDVIKMINVLEPPHVLRVLIWT